MVRGTFHIRGVAQSRSIQACENTSTVRGGGSRYRRDPPDLVLAKVGVQISSSSDGPTIWIFSHARRRACSLVDSHLSFLGRRCLSNSLLWSSVDFGLESGPS